MADKRLDQVSTSTSPDYIIGTTSAGDVVRISRRDLISVDESADGYKEILVPTYADPNSNSIPSQHLSGLLAFIKDKYPGVTNTLFKGQLYRASKYRGFFRLFITDTNSSNIGNATTGFMFTDTKFYLVSHGTISEITGTKVSDPGSPESPGTE